MHYWFEIGKTGPMDDRPAGHRDWPDDEALLELWARYGVDPDAPYDVQEEAYAALFDDPWFQEIEERRRQRYAAEGMPVMRRTSAGGSFMTAAAIGMRNVFDPDQKKDEIVAVAERGDGDGDGDLKLDLDPENPLTTRAVIRRKLPKA
jgi:hypothetical protein